MTPQSFGICKKMLSAPFQPSWESVQKQIHASIQEWGVAKPLVGIHVKKRSLSGMSTCICGVFFRRAAPCMLCPRMT